MSKEENEDNLSLHHYILKAVKDSWLYLNEWMAFNPEDNFFIKVLKFFGKIVVICLFILLSPVVLLTLIIAFIVAF